MHNHKQTIGQASADIDSVPMLIIQDENHWRPDGTPEAPLARIEMMLKNYDLDPRLDTSDSKKFEESPLRRPFRHPMFRSAGTCWSSDHDCIVYKSGQPIYAKHPDAVCFLFGFLEISHCLSVTTDDQELIAKLDAAIADAMKRPGYIVALAHHIDREIREGRRPKAATATMDFREGRMANIAKVLSHNPGQRP